MFLHYFTHEQRMAFLGLVRQFMLADDRYAIQEWHLFNRMKAEWNFPAETPIPDHNLSTLAEAFTDRRIRVAVLLEIIVLGYTDNNFHPTENFFVQALATHFDIHESELPILENWAQRQIVLILEARRLMLAPNETEDMVSDKPI